MLGIVTGRPVLPCMPQLDLHISGVARWQRHCRQLDAPHQTMPLRGQRVVAASRCCNLGQTCVMFAGAPWPTLCTLCTPNNLNYSEYIQTQSLTIYISRVLRGPFVLSPSYLERGLGLLVGLSARGSGKQRGPFFEALINCVQTGDRRGRVRFFGLNSFFLPF